MLHFRPIPFFGAVAALLLTGCYDSRFGEPDDDGEGKPATETIAALRDRYAGTPFTVTGDIVVMGRVASWTARRISTARSASATLKRDLR